LQSLPELLFHDLSTDSVLYHAYFHLEIQDRTFSGNGVNLKMSMKRKKLKY